MKNNILILFFLSVFLSAGCLTTGVKKEKNDKIKTYSEDLYGDMQKEIIEVEDKFDKEGKTQITVKKPGKKKEVEILDTTPVYGKVRKFELVDLDNSGQKRMAVIFDDSDNVPNIIIYKLQNNRLAKMFEAASIYGIDAELGACMPRVKIGKAPTQGTASPNLVPEWDSWVWSGDKFIKEQ